MGKMKHFLSVLLIFGLIALNFECTDAASEESDGSGDSEESDESDEPEGSGVSKESDDSDESGGSGDSEESSESERTWGRRRGSRRRRRRFGFGSGLFGFFGSQFRRLRFQCLGQCRVTGATTCSVTPFPIFFNPSPTPVTYQCSQLFPFGILTG